MVVDELVRLQDVNEDVLSWTRPNFFAIRYELVCSSGVLSRITVHGIGRDRHVLAETAEAEWRFDIFPLNRPEVPIRRAGASDPEAVYVGGNPASVRFVTGGDFRLSAENAGKMLTIRAGGKPLFTVELVEAFPRWRADLKLEPDALAVPELPILLASACCFLVFT